MAVGIPTTVHGLFKAARAIPDTVTIAPASTLGIARFAWVSKDAGSVGVYVPSSGASLPCSVGTKVKVVDVGVPVTVHARLAQVLAPFVYPDSVTI